MDSTVRIQIIGRTTCTNVCLDSERGMQRFYVLLDGEVTLEKTQASVRRHMAPHAVDFTHIEWFSKFESTSCPLSQV